MAQRSPHFRSMAPFRYGLDGAQAMTVIPIPLATGRTRALPSATRVAASSATSSASVISLGSLVILALALMVVGSTLPRSVRNAVGFSLAC
jgi:hypothetical protein